MADDATRTPSGSRYNWVLVSECTGGSTWERAVQTGPQDALDTASVEILIARGERFRLRDSGGEIRYTGFILGSFSGREPLEDFGAAHGCTGIEYDCGGKWIALEPEDYDDLEAL